MMRLLYDSLTGRSVSIGSILSDPIPAGLTVYEMIEVETVGVMNGSLMWDPQSISFIPNPGWTAPAES